MKSISLVIITFNEEANIEQCIKSTGDIADEIIVVDSFSTDKTCEIATACGARVLQHKFEGHVQQKNWAKEQARCNWVLSLDADETLDSVLFSEIKKWKHIEQYHTTGLILNRLNFYCGKPYRTFGWYPDKKIRLWKKELGTWKGVNPHDQLVMNRKEPTKALRGHILHNTYPTRESFLEQREKFANIAALHIKEENILFLLFKLIFSAPYKFFRCYILHFGVIEGFNGWFICYHLSREVFLKYYRAIKYKLS